MNDTDPVNQILQDLLARRDLSEAQMRSMMVHLMSGDCCDAHAAAFLVALKMKGESAGELAAAARVLRERMVRWHPSATDVLDTCGTGGDGLATFNISTAAALVIAAAGVPVVKHGNRSVTSRSGSSDVLAALGVPIDGDAAHADSSLQAAGFAFCFAPNFHPALKHVAPVRRSLGIPTIFNCLGPLANPAGARRQLLGVGQPGLLELMAEALAELGTTHAVVVCSHEGLDEVSLSAPTTVRRVRGGDIRSEEWSVADFGLDPCRLADLVVADAQESARVILKVLSGEDGPATSVVLANAAAGLLAAERVTGLRDGVELAREALRSGRALEVLRRLQRRGASDDSKGGARL